MKNSRVKILISAILALALSNTSIVSAQSAVTEIKQEQNQAIDKRNNLNRVSDKDFAKAFFFGIGPAAESLAEKLNNRGYDQFKELVKSDLSISQRNAQEDMVESVLDTIDNNNPGLLADFHEDVRSGDPYLVEHALITMQEATNDGLKDFLQDQGHISAQDANNAQPMAAIPVWAAALAVQWAGVAIQYAVYVNAAIAVSVALSTVTWVESGNSSLADDLSHQEKIADLAESLKR